MSGNSTRKSGWTRRLVTIGGAALAGGVGYAALRQPQRQARLLRAPYGVLRRGNVAEPNTLDPSLSSAIWEDAIMGELLVGLMTEDVAAKAIPGMAKSWTTSPDGLTWTFTLREALWSDGLPVTAEDFIFAWRRLVDPKTASSYGYFIDVFRGAAQIGAGKLPPEALGARAIDPRTLEIQLTHPAPYLLQMLTHATTFPQPRHIVMAKGKDWAKPGTYVGNGAFTLAEWIPNSHVTVVKNPRFFDAANVALEQVIFYPTDDYGAALRQLRAGELDTQDRLPGQEINWIKANMPEMRSPVPQLIEDMIAINFHVRPFDDVRVRHAMNLLVNRKVITEKITRAGEVPAYNFVPPRVANYPGTQAQNVTSMKMPDRIAQAQMLMRQAGFGPDKPVKATFLLRSTAAGTYPAIAAALQQMLALAWINISIVPNEAQIFDDRLQEHDFELAQPGWGADFDDASSFLDIFRTGNGNNWGQYSNHAFDLMMDSAQSEIDIKLRGNKLARAEAILLGDYAAVPLFYWANTNLVRPYVKGWIANELDKNRSRWLSIDEKARAATVIS